MYAPARRAKAIAMALLFALSLLACSAASALAAPSDQILGLTALQAKLDASGTVDGYMKTVVKGSAITAIPVSVSAVTEGPYGYPVIMFQATGPLIASYGGIVDGMSGSPIYITDEGADKVVGAVSFGEESTLGGTGLATPIENMLNIKQKYAPGFMKLDRPIVTRAGIVNSILVTDDHKPTSAAISGGVAVVHPLHTPVFVGGLSPNSRVFKRAQALFAKRGATLISRSGGLSASPVIGDQSFETTLAPGSSIGALESRGALWSGGIGTVTYTDSDTVLAFGHPMAQSGNTEIYMTNAWIDGIWSSSVEPYKLGRPGKVRGTITQDRGAGIMGVLNQFPAETTITAEATNADTGETTTSVTYAPRSVFNTLQTGDDWEQLAADELSAYATYMAGYYLFDQYYTPGSAQTTTTVVVRDTDKDQLHTITIPNLVDDEDDIPSAICWGAAEAVMTLRHMLVDDVHHYEILSIDLTSRISAKRKSAEIVDVSVPAALKTGDNSVTVSFLAIGKEDTQTVTVKLTIPAGTSTHGRLTAFASGNGMDQFPGQETLESDVATGSRLPDVADITKLLNSSLPGNYFTLRYTPTVSNAGSSYLGGWMDEEEDEGDDEPDLPDPATMKSVTTTVGTEWALDGDATVNPTSVAIGLRSRVMPYNGYNVLFGAIADGPNKPGIISLYGTPAGSSVESLLATTTVNARTGMFTFNVNHLRVNTQLRVHTNASPDEGYMPSDTFVTAYVNASVRLDASATSISAGRAVKLTARVSPGQNAGAKVVFEYYAKGRWRRIATKTLAAGGTAWASTSWKVIRGSHKVRFRFLGSGYNAATTSASRTIRGR